MTVIRSAAKGAALTYIVALAITLPHFVNTIKRELFQLNPAALLAPAYSIGIVRAYGQFISARTWPFGSRPNVIYLDDFISANRRGARDTVTYVSVPFNLNPELRPGQEGRTGYLLTYEAYQTDSAGAVVDISAGSLMRIGRYFCLMPDGPGLSEKLMGPSQCYELISRPGKRFYWRALGSDVEQAVGFGW